MSVKPDFARALVAGYRHTEAMDHNALRENLGRILREQGKSARSVSLRAGLGESAVKHILSGQSRSPTLATLQAIASELHVRMADLTGPSASEASASSHSLPREIVEDQAELRLLRYWRTLEAGERGYLLNLVRKSSLGD